MPDKPDVRASAFHRHGEEHLRAIIDHFDEVGAHGLLPLYFGDGERRGGGVAGCEDLARHFEQLRRGMCGISFPCRRASSIGPQAAISRKR